ncbi:MAG: hypothetical protein ACE5K7_03100, partial [Phycisphaerae bacterium]
MGRGLFDEQFLRIAQRRGHWRQEEAEARITAARGLLARCAGREYRRDDWPGLCRRLYLPLLRLLGFQASRVGGRGGERFLQYRLSGPIGQSRIRAILTLPGQDPALADIEAAAILCRGEADWLIVTNGLSWRLQRRAGWGGLEAYQIELPCGAGQNVGDQDGEAFARWWRLLRAEAFAPQPGSRESWLDELAADYRGHMERLTAGLADRAVFAALPLLTEGVAVEAARRCRWCWPPEQERLELAYRAGIILLYRILFVLHAEARRVWPCNQRAYPSESLAELAVRAARRIEGCPDQFGEQADPGGDGRRRLQGSLRQRLRLLAGGCAGDNLLLACGERGGQDHWSGACRLLERCRIGDYYLAAALRLLVWDRPGGANPTSIDYATIDPGHLGQIYERIVSLQPAVAEDDLVRLGSRGGPRYVRLRAGVRRRTGRAVRLIRKGHIYLRPAPGRRKATGRYYTPASVIATLLQRALEPVIEQ